MKSETQVLYRRSAWRIVRREYVLYLFLVPAVGFTFFFAYLPMFMNVIAFMDYSIFSGWLGLGSRWVGLKWFQRFLSDPDFYAVAWRTLYYSFVKLAFSFPAPIILALLLNELRSQAYKRAVQTISYMPFFVSWVTVSGLIYMFLSTSSGGLINNIVELLGGKRIIFMSKTVYFLPILVVSELWKNTGWGSIIYIAAIASIEQQLYEAARIDGAGRWRQMISITLPGILPAVVILLILTAGGVFNANFDQMVNLQNPVIKSDTNVINVYSYYVGVVAKKYAMGTAINFFQALVNFALVWGTNFFAKRIRGTGLFYGLVMKVRNRIRRSVPELAFDGANMLLMLCVAVVMIYPLWYVIVYALNNSQDSAAGHLWLWPRKFTLENIAFVLQKPILQRSYLVTVLRTISGPLLNLIVTGFAAFALSKRYLPGRKFLTYYLILPMFIGSPIVATYVVYARMHLLNNFLVYILPGAFTFFMMAVARAFIEELPASLEESAKMDGAGYLRIFFQLVVPLSTPIIATMLIFSAVGNWLDFYTNLLFVSSDRLYTLQYLLYIIVQQQGATAGVMGAMQQTAQGNTAQFKISSESVNMTTLVIVTLPILLVYPFFQRYIIKGVLIGAIKE